MADDFDDVLPGKIQSILQEDLEADDMDMISSQLRTDKDIRYGRQVIQTINNKPLKLYDTMSRRGDIDESTGDYSNLIRILEKAKVKKTASLIRDAIKDHKPAPPMTNSQQTTSNEFHRPQDLSLGAGYKHSMCSPSTPDSVFSPNNAKTKRYSFRDSTSGGSRESVDGDGITPLSFYLSKKDNHYPFNPNFKGLVAIINNFTNSRIDGIFYRDGTLEDEEEIVKFFTTGDFVTHYEVLPTRKNLNHLQFEGYLNELKDKLINGNYNSFFLFILSHGDADGVKTYHNNHHNPPKPEAISVDKITQRFHECLPDRPKVFVIQACQGRADNKTPEEVLPDASSPEDHQPDDDGTEEEVESDEMDVGGPPEAADMLTAFATVKGFRSYRRKGGAGSWFIQKLMGQLREAHKDHYFSSHLLDLLIEVHREVAEKKGTTPNHVSGKKVIVKQMPYYQSSLRKKFYLLPQPRLPSYYRP